MTDSSSPVQRALLRGMWRLASRVDRDAGGRRHIDPTLGEDPLGLLCFSEHHFAAQFMKRDRSGPTPGSGTVAGVNNSSAVDGYDAYFGTYAIDEAGGTLTVRLEGAITPANIGAAFERTVAVSGDRLTISLATTAADGTPLTRTLTFVRLA